MYGLVKKIKRAIASNAINLRITKFKLETQFLNSNLF